MLRSATAPQHPLLHSTPPPLRTHTRTPTALSAGKPRVKLLCNSQSRYGNLWKPIVCRAFA